MISLRMEFKSLNSPALAAKVIAARAVIPNRRVMTDLFMTAAPQKMA